MRFYHRTTLLFSLLFFAFSLHADQRKTTSTSLQQMLQKSGYIFSGTVMSVQRTVPKTENEVATVQITFHVDQAIRGVVARQTLTIREWAGLWNSNDRYHLGEHVLLFLYHPSRLGLTSPVAGDFGRYKLDSAGRIMAGRALVAEVLGNDPAKNNGGKKNIPTRGVDFARTLLAKENK
jgi:hypothetical protein